MGGGFPGISEIPIGKPPFLGANMLVLAEVCILHPIVLVLVLGDIELKNAGFC